MLQLTKLHSQSPLQTDSSLQWGICTFDVPPCIKTEFAFDSLYLMIVSLPTTPSSPNYLTNRKSGGDAGLLRKTNFLQSNTGIEKQLEIRNSE